MTINFENVIVSAMVQAFLQPVIGGTHMTPDGKEQIWWTTPQAWSLASTLYDRYKDELLTKVSASIDLDALAEKIAAKILSNLAEMPTTYGWHSTSAHNLQDELRRRVIEKLAEAKVAELLAIEEETT